MGRFERVSYFEKMHSQIIAFWHKCQGIIIMLVLNFELHDLPFLDGTLKTTQYKHLHYCKFDL